MQLKNTVLAFALAVVAGFGLTRCGTGLGGDGKCTVDTDCQTGEICHIGQQACVKSCAAQSECTQPNSCVTASWDAAKKFCGCTVNGHCGSSEVCQLADSRCAAACSTADDCNGRACNSGQCAAASGTDGGTGACNWSNCSNSSFSMQATGRTCSASGTCGAGPACTGAGQSTCANNSYCASSTCGYPTYPTQTACQNLYAGEHPNGPVWNPASSTGPVIYSITEDGHGPGLFGTSTCPSNANIDTSNCQCNPGDTQWNIRVLAYRNDTAWPQDRSGLSGFFYVPTNGVNRDILTSPTLLRPNSGYNPGPTANHKVFNVYHCASNAANAFQPAYFFTGGNEVCRQF
ncbi:MAG: hypothetical protein ACT4TC_19035 [Myxococcaceae bacterium]